MHFLASSDLPYEAPQSSSSISLFEYGSNVLQAVEIRVVAFMPNLKNMLKKEEEERIERLRWVALNPAVPNFP
jgi:hypothetical protein